MESGCEQNTGILMLHTCGVGVPSLAVPEFFMAHKAKATLGVCITTNSCEQVLVDKCLVLALMVREEN